MPSSQFYRGHQKEYFGFKRRINKVKGPQGINTTKKAQRGVRDGEIEGWWKA